MTPYKPAPIAQINTLQLLDHKLTFPESFKEYNSVREGFNRRLHEAQEEMSSFYQSQVTDPSDLLSTAARMLDRINEESAAFAASVLMYYGIDHVSAKDLLRPGKRTFRETDENGNVTKKTIDVGKSFQSLREDFLGKIAAQVKSLEELADDMSTQREIERSGRSKWVGGGYGIRGAISGAIKASALNAGTSVLRGIGDSITDASDASKIRKLGRNLVKDGATLDTYNTIVGMTLDGLEMVTLGYLCGTLEGTLPSGQKPVLTYKVSDGAAKTARSRLENYASMYEAEQIDLATFKSKALECMLKNVWDEDNWQLIYTSIEADTEKREIIDIMPYMGLQHRLGPMLLDFENGYIDFLKEKRAPRDVITEAKAESAGRVQLVENLMTASPERLANVYIVRAYVRKNGFYVESVSGGVGSMKQEEYAVEIGDDAKQSLPVQLTHNAQPFSGKAKLTMPDYVYVGEFSEGYAHGKGKVTYSDGESFDGILSRGTWANGCWSGTGETYAGAFLFDNGQHMRHGKGKSTYLSGFDFPVEHGTKLGRKERKQRGEAGAGTVEGTFQNNKIQGPVQIQSSIVEITGQCVDHVLEGKANIRTPEFTAVAEYRGGQWVYGEIRYANGDVYRGDIANPDGIGRSWARTGHGTCTFANGDVYEGEWADGQRHGAGTQRSASGETYVGAWECGKRQGQGTLTDASGAVVYEGEWKKDKRKGGVFSKLFGGRK